MQDNYKETESLERRILVIDDNYPSRINSSLELFGPKSRNLLILNDKRKNREWNEASIDYILKEYEGASFEIGQEPLIIRALGEEQYGVILLDGHLGMDLEGQFYDGAVVARKLRNGEYGSLNQRTPILSISADRDSIPLADDHYDFAMLYELIEKYL